MGEFLGRAWGPGESIVEGGWAAKKREEKKGKVRGKESWGRKSSSQLKTRCAVDQKEKEPLGKKLVRGRAASVKKKRGTQKARRMLP